MGGCRSPAAFLGGKQMCTYISCASRRGKNWTTIQGWKTWILRWRGHAKWHQTLLQKSIDFRWCVFRSRFFPRFHVSSFVLFYVVIFCRVFYPNASAYTIYRPKFQCWTQSSTIVSVEGLILVCSGPNHAAKAQHWNLGGGGRQKLACYGKSSRANISLDIAGRHDINKYSHQNGFKLYWNQTISLPNRRLPVIIGNLGQGVSEQHPLLWELDRKSTLHTVKVNPYSQHLVWIPRVWTIP